MKRAILVVLAVGSYHVIPSSYFRITNDSVDMGGFLLVILSPLLLTIIFAAFYGPNLKDKIVFGLITGTLFPISMMLYQLLIWNDPNPLENKYEVLRLNFFLIPVYIMVFIFFGMIAEAGNRMIRRFMKRQKQSLDVDN